MKYPKFTRVRLAATLITMFAGSGLLIPSAATATPVTYLYDSGSFFSNAFYDAHTSPQFGTHFTAAFTFSNDFDPTVIGNQCLYTSGTNSTCGGSSPIASLLNWSVTSGNFTLNSGNAHIGAQGYYPGLEFYSYKGTNSGPFLTVVFDVIGNDTQLGIEIQGRTFGGSNGSGDINVVSGLSGYQAINTGGYGSTVASYNYTGPGGLGGSGTGTGGLGGSGTGPGTDSVSIPEPGTVAMILLGFVAIGFVKRQRVRPEMA